MKTIGLVGYGNLGKGVEKMAEHFSDLELKYIFTRRNVSDISTYNKNIAVIPYTKISEYKSTLDCLILAGGSKRDLTYQSRELAEHFNIVDSFDNHTEIKEHIKKVEENAVRGGRCAVVSSGWDPGLFSLMRLYFSAFMPRAAVNTFWGYGVSQGHSEALRGISGVKYAVQYTAPSAEAQSAAERGEIIESKRAHRRICYIVAEEESREYIINEVRNMENYFSGYETEINFISEAEFFENHLSLPHGGSVISHVSTPCGSQLATLSLKLSSNPDFTAGILLASARAVCRLYSIGERGAKTLFDIPPKLLFDADPQKLM